MRVLYIVPDWPTNERPSAVPFVVQQFNFLKSTGLEIDLLVLKGEKKIINYIRNFFLFKKAITTTNYDCLHFQWAYTAIYSLPFSNIPPVIITARGTDLSGIKSSNLLNVVYGKILISVSNFCISKSRFLIVVSNKLMENINLKNRSNLKYSVIPSGIDFSKIPKVSKEEVRKKMGFDNDQIVIVFPYNISRKGKGYEILVDSINQINPELKVNLKVQVIDKKSRMELWEFFIASDLLVLPSSSEGSPNVIKEALAVNLPIVSFDVGDVKERLAGVNGSFVCSNKNSDQLKIEILNFLKFDYSNYKTEQLILDLDENLLTQRILDIYHYVINKQNE
jgi:teichuronic acid biosynthesis glycosyltransferase TuaC